MKTICIYFSVHQPVRLRKFSFFEIGNSDYYYDDYNNENIIRRVAKNCYLPANKILLELLNKYNGAFKVSFSISGSALDQFKIYAPEVIESFQELAGTGCVEFLAETNSHSFAFLKNKNEFMRQVRSNSIEIESLFNYRPTTFANTHLIYRDEIGAFLTELGYKTILTQGPVNTKGRYLNYICLNNFNESLHILLKSEMLSDDISQRFSKLDWSEWPLTAKKYVSWLNKISESQNIVNLFMDYETFGERQKSETGIFDFLESLPEAIFRNSNYEFSTPSEIGEQDQSFSKLNLTQPFPWSIKENTLSNWLGNELQQEAFENLYELSVLVDQCVDDPDRLRDWHYLQASDHFIYMSTEYFSNYYANAYINPYDSPYEAFMNYMNVLNDFAMRLKKSVQKKKLSLTN